MIPHNFNSVTHRGVTGNCPAGPGEYTIMLSLKQSRDFIDHPTRYMWDDATQSLGDWPGWEPEETSQLALVELKAAEITIRDKYAAMLVSITAPYGAAERETWKTQEEEASKWTSVSNGFATDPEFPDEQVDLCPMIRGMATARGIPIALMVAKILKNAGLFREASGQILGMQQAELDLLYPAKKEKV